MRQISLQHGTPLGGPLIWPSVSNQRLAITHQHRVNHVEAADSITVSTVFYVLSRRKIELRDSPRLSLVVSDFVQLDSISVRKPERRAVFLYKYLYIVIPSHVEVIYQDDILLPVAVTGDVTLTKNLGFQSFISAAILIRDQKNTATPPSVFMLKIKSVCYIWCKGYLRIQIQCCMPCSYRFQVNFEKKGINQEPKTALFF